MADLHSQFKSFFPDYSDDEIEDGIFKIRQESANVSDDEILKSAMDFRKIQDDGSLMKEMARQDVRQKYGIAERKAILDQNEKEASAPNWQAGLAALGAGLQGQDAAAAGMAVKKNQEAERQSRLNQFDKNRDLSISERDDALKQEKLAKENDPSSVESKMAQDLAVAMGMNPEQVKGLTASRFKEFSPALQKKYEIAQRSADRKELALYRKDMNSAREYDKQLARDERKARDAKPSDKQIESFTDIDNAVSDLDNIVSTLGKNSQWTGPVDGRIPNLLVGEDQNAWRSAVGKYKDAYRKAITGAGASNQEIARLESRLPSETDTFDTFRAKAAEAKKELNRKKEIMASNLEKGGKNVESFKSPKMVESPKSTVRMRDPKGNIRLVPRDQVAAAQKAGGVLVDGEIASKYEEDPNGV